MSSLSPEGHRESLKEIKARMKKKMEEKTEVPSLLSDPYANVCSSMKVVRGLTGVSFDKEVLKHKCEWDENYPENPTRLSCVLDKCREDGLFDRCLKIPNNNRNVVLQNVLLVHTKEHYDKLEAVCQNSDFAKVEEEASNYDAIYFNQYSFDSACRSLSSVLNLVTAVARNDVQNGMALVRPPGHHAMHDEFNGYCFFNNVAIAAAHCIKEKLASRVLIVDFDVHHGQGVQRTFYERKDVLYFSIHRYEYGTFWPNLHESNFNYIGKGEGLGYNVNVPLNATGLTDDEYLAIVLSILLPLGYEFNPDLIIVAAGYDAACGCFEGRMLVTPGFYQHLITLLSGLAQGKIAVCLEGGYFYPTLAQGAAMTLKGLLGDPCPYLDPVRGIHPTVIDTICNVRRALRNIWRCFQVCDMLTESEVGEDGLQGEHSYILGFLGETCKPPYLTRNCYPLNLKVDQHYYAKLNEALIERYNACSHLLPVCYAYNEKMLQHTPKKGDSERPERPERISSILDTFKEHGIDTRCTKTPITKRDYSTYNPHDPKYFAQIGENLEAKDLYVNEETRECVDFAVSGLLDLCDLVMVGEARSGVAIVRPPGHHAEHNKAMGFCFANNVAIAANYLLQKYDVQRILIVDFDVHHGNGTQNMFYHTQRVMYVSVHRDDDGKFFPLNSPRSHTFDGHGSGKGYNLNIPFNKDKMGDSEYLAVFHNVILPAAYSYGPQFVLVSAGFDAGINDPLGGYQINPETFGHFIQMLKPLAEGKLILALEGGYNLTTTSYGMGICTKVLLGDPVSMPKDLYKIFSSEACHTIRLVTNHFKKFFPIFTINKKLSPIPVLCKRNDRFCESSYQEPMYKVLNADKAEDSTYIEENINCFNS